jgi:hypothetical protein
MTDPGKIHYLLIIDRSGSMRDIRDDTEGGIRSFVDTQLENPGTHTVSLHQFDTVHEEVFDFAPLEQARDYKLEPRGGTALLDACGQAVTSAGAKLAALPEDERPGQVFVVIATDGHENSSREYTRDKVREMIQHQQDAYGWKFTYIGANQDAFAEGASLGIMRPSVLSWLGTSRGTQGAWNAVGRGVSASASAGTTYVSYTPADRDEAQGK